MSAAKIHCEACGMEGELTTDGKTVSQFVTATKDVPSRCQQGHDVPYLTDCNEWMTAVRRALQTVIPR